MHLIKEEKIGVNLIVNIFTECYNADTFNWSHTPVYLIIHWCHIRLARIPPCCWQNNLDRSLFAGFWYEIPVRADYFYLSTLGLQNIFIIILSSLLCSHPNLGKAQSVWGTESQASGLWSPSIPCRSCSNLDILFWLQVLHKPVQLYCTHGSNNTQTGPEYRYLPFVNVLRISYGLLCFPIFFSTMLLHILLKGMIYHGERILQLL